MKNIAVRVRAIIVDLLNLKDGNVTGEARIMDDLGADSLDIVEMIVALEEDFGIEIPDENAEKMSTVGDVAKYVKDRCISSV